MNNIKESRKKDDWKQWKNGWKYKTDAPQNREWKKDRAKLFRENGNGWWITPPATDLPKNRLGRKKLAKQIEKRKSNVR